MRIDELRALLKARPFRPFTIYTPDGGAIPVWHPDFALLSPDGRTLWVYQRDYSCEMIDVMLAARFSFNAPDAAPPADGAAQPGAA
jgi:hypothetical protein